MTETLEAPLQGQLTYPGEIRRYIIGGNATFTVVFGEVIGRYTFKIKSNKKDWNANWSTGNQDKSKYWVSFKHGPNDSYTDYTTIGVLVEDKINGGYYFSPKLNQSGQMHFVAALFDSLWGPLENGCTFQSNWEFWHEGSCCICGRKLTVPESVADGIGPECKGKVGL